MAAVKRVAVTSEVSRSRLDSQGEAKLVEIACSEAPEGQARWSLCLLADRLVKLEIVDSISHSARLIPRSRWSVSTSCRCSSSAFNSLLLTQLNVLFIGKLRRAPHGRSPLPMLRPFTPRSNWLGGGQAIL